MKKIIAITLGDVAGIGPEVVRKALRSRRLDRRFDYQVILEKEIPEIRPGRPSSVAAQFAVRSLAAAVDGCLSGRYAAMVTAPVNKAGLHRIGFRHPGQTEWLAERTKTRKFAMMLTGGGLRVSLVTIHEPLRKVASLLSVSKMVDTIEVTHHWLKMFGIKKPRILVAALNPHGGVPAEQGIEEKKIIVPAIRKAQQKLGRGISGPYSPDHVFWLARQGEGDAVVCMYHDQGLIPLKMLSFDTGVNLTLGLPIIRTSPDHGTAYDIAGKNRASAKSMIEAIRLAAHLARQA